MAISSKAPNGETIADINTTPLIDVMLVLLVILIITLPVQTNAVKLVMPRIGPQTTPPVVIAINVDFDGTAVWNGERVDRATLDARLAKAARQSPQPVIHLTADRLARYDAVAKVLADAQRLGVTNIAIVNADDYVK